MPAAAAAAKLLVRSDSVRPHRRQPNRLPRPWDSPGKNTGVGCHFLLQYRKMKSESEVTQSCLTLRDPMDCSPPGSSVHGILQARVLEWVGLVGSNQFLSCPMGVSFFERWCTAPFPPVTLRQLFIFSYYFISNEESGSGSGDLSSVIIRSGCHL